MADPITRDAAIDPTGLYRYTLTRRWGDGTLLPFVMLNPSAADALVDDPTIRRCIGFARREGAAGIVVANLFAYRATNPREMLRHADPVGPDNDDHLLQLRDAATAAGMPIVAAWGGHGTPARVAKVAAILGAGDLRCLGVTRAGAPRHPLHVRSDAPLASWQLASAGERARG